jgi:hypothetical protein
MRRKTQTDPHLYVGSFFESLTSCTLSTAQHSKNNGVRLVRKHVSSPHHIEKQPLQFYFKMPKPRKGSAVQASFSVSPWQSKRAATEKGDGQREADECIVVEEALVKENAIASPESGLTGAARPPSLSAVSGKGDWKWKKLGKKEAAHASLHVDMDVDEECSVEGDAVEEDPDPESADGAPAVGAAGERFGSGLLVLRGTGFLTFLPNKTMTGAFMYKHTHDSYLGGFFRLGFITAHAIMGRVPPQLMK